MCGIAGVLSINGKLPDERTLANVSAKLLHRGPDGEGRSIYSATSQAGRIDVALIHRRLAIIDLTEAGHQPMERDGGRLSIVFNGEIYNYVELREELSALGHRFESRSDTEVLLAAYQQWGTDCLPRLNGMWAFAIWDARKSRLFCAVDHFGIKPLHFSWDGKQFLFASEAKALVTTGLLAPKANRKTLIRYLGYNILPDGSETFFEDLSRLRAGTALVVEGSGIKSWTWWKPRAPEPDGGDRVKEVRELLIESVRLRLRSDVPVASCLSGGVDSSILVSIMAAQLQSGGAGAPRTFSAVFPSAACDESSHIDRVIEQTRVLPRFVRPDSTALDRDLERLVWHQEEPFANLTIFAQWAVMRGIHEDQVKVTLDGQGADELFWGYNWYYVAKLREAIRAGQYASALREAHCALRVNETLTLKSFLATNVYFGATSLRGAVGRRRMNGFLQPRLRDELALEELPDGAGLGLDFIGDPLAGLLRYEDRNSMAHSVETRLPFLDPRLVEVCLSIPYASRIRDGWTKRVLRDAASGLAPHEAVWRRCKRGFDVPDRSWLTALKPRLTSYFDQSAAEPWVVPDECRRALRDDSFDPNRLWRLINVELWARAFSIR